MYVYRIAVLWNSRKIHASVLQNSHRALHLLVHDTTISVSSIISGIYAPAQPREKDSFWQYLIELTTVFDLPWCIIGDFNEIASPSEKQGGQVFPCNKYWRLNQFLSLTKGVFVPVNGSIFTWKKRLHMHLIYERLDRAIVCNKWGDYYPESLMGHGSFACSDHCPIILTTDSLIQRKKQCPFRF